MASAEMSAVCVNTIRHPQVLTVGFVLQTPTRCLPHRQQLLHAHAMPGEECDDEYGLARHSVTRVRTVNGKAAIGIREGRASCKLGQCCQQGIHTVQGFRHETRTLTITASLKYGCLSAGFAGSPARLLRLHREWIARGAKQTWASYPKGGPVPRLQAGVILSTLPISASRCRYLLATTLLLCMSCYVLRATWGGGHLLTHNRRQILPAPPEVEGKSSVQPPSDHALLPFGRTVTGRDRNEPPSLLHRLVWAIVTALVGPQHPAVGGGNCLALAALDATRGHQGTVHGQKIGSLSLLGAHGGGRGLTDVKLMGNTLMSQYPHSGATRLAFGRVNGSVKSGGRWLVEGHDQVELSTDGDPSAATLHERHQSGRCVANKWDKRDDCPGGAVCVGGGCTCPLLRSLGETLDPRMGCREDRPVDANSEWCIMSLANFTQAHSRQSPPRLFALEAARVKGAPELDLPYLADWSTCAVVGNSDSLLKTELGAEIDAHSAVIRFNDAPTRQLAAHVGGKTTLRIQNIDYCGFHEGDDEIMLHYTPPSKNALKGDPCAKTPALKLSSHFLDYEMSYFRQLLNMRYSKVIPKGDPAGGKSKLSAGFFGVALALHLCGTVDIYGFSQSDRRYYKKSRNVGGGHTFALKHNWKMERGCLNLLGKGLWEPRVMVRN
eukprot:jgi/Mesvir1/24615/Mv21930-RA.1